MDEQVSLLSTCAVIANVFRLAVWDYFTRVAGLLRHTERVGWYAMSVVQKCSFGIFFSPKIEIQTAFCNVVECYGPSSSLSSRQVLLWGGGD